MDEFNPKPDDIVDIIVAIFIVLVATGSVALICLALYWLFA